jgi:uncharacterized RDD family membrane protein YckC
MTRRYRRLSPISPSIPGYAPGIIDWEADSMSDVGEPDHLPDTQADRLTANRPPVQQGPSGTGWTHPNAIPGQIIPGGVIPAGTQLASPWARLGSYLLDSLLILVTLFIGWLIWAMFTWRNGQSPAKSLLGLRVTVKQTGRAATWGKMFVRDILVRLLIGFLSALTFGIVGMVAVLMIFSTFHETMWDKFAGTLVVRDPAGATLPSAVGRPQYVS